MSVQVQHALQIGPSSPQASVVTSGHGLGRGGKGEGRHAAITCSTCSSVNVRSSVLFMRAPYGQGSHTGSSGGQRRVMVQRGRQSPGSSAAAICSTCSSLSSSNCSLSIVGPPAPPPHAELFATLTPGWKVAKWAESQSRKGDAADGSPAKPPAAGLVVKAPRCFSVHVNTRYRSVPLRRRPAW